MKSLIALVVLALSLGVTSAAASSSPLPSKKKLQSFARTIVALKQAQARQLRAGGTEDVACTGPSGTTVTYRTGTGDGRPLAGTVSVRIAGKTTQYPPLLMTNYLNTDSTVAMRVNAATPKAATFTLQLALAPTPSPKANQVATYTGTVAVGGNEADISCAVTRAGAGELKPYPFPAPGFINVVCMRQGTAPGPDEFPLLSLAVLRAATHRLSSSVLEARAETDFEIFPSARAPQFRFGADQIRLEVDDAAAPGTLSARLVADGVRVPTGMPASEPAMFGQWAGTYKRFDAGRELDERVECYAF